MNNKFTTFDIMRLSIIILFLPFAVISQDRGSDKLINIKYENGIDSLIIKNQEIINKNEGILGWRVQLTFKSTKEEIKKIRVNFRKLYPDIPTYLTYDPPYYKICVGDFRTKNEALKLNNFIRKNYIEAYPVQKIIPISLIRN
tara:strand:- start:66 stop:494 length:429 start_codon:yes stop_codon:yes gene_type:complete